ncbi:hypothetical protein DPMN_180403 [Dreissena polymorpha]|uniref:Uncharacterized protein n=1 Tax=Dreissena polymorpha TaxID=45954 RepID=A0A9D4IKF7_DREPO|nr:hypothetical protein DPMN_180403 [Dreissena polymorpha]
MQGSTGHEPADKPRSNSSNPACAANTLPATPARHHRPSRRSAVQMALNTIRCVW